MNTAELQTRLLDEGCNGFCIGSCYLQSDVYCLDQEDGQWIVFYTERGLHAEPIFSSSAENEACEYFFNLITSMEHRHIVGFFREAQHAIDLEQTLNAMGIATVRNDIPYYGGPDDPRFRVFVVGKDIFRVRETLGDLPVRDEL